MKITVEKAPTSSAPVDAKAEAPPTPEPEPKSSDIDLTKVIKTEEIKLGNKLRYQIFVPEVLDVQCEKLNNSGGGFNSKIFLKIYKLKNLK